MPVIRVYIDDSCLGCKRAEELVQVLTVRYPMLDVATVNVVEGINVPDSLFALPTWYVNEQLWMLGNPSWSELVDLVNGQRP